MTFPLTAKKKIQKIQKEHFFSTCFKIWQVGSHSCGSKVFVLSSLIFAATLKKDPPSYPLPLPDLSTLMVSIPRVTLRSSDFVVDHPATEWSHSRWTDDVRAKWQQRQLSQSDTNTWYLFQLLKLNWSRFPNSGGGCLGEPVLFWRYIASHRPFFLHKEHIPEIMWFLGSVQQKTWTLKYLLT